MIESDANQLKKKNKLTHSHTHKSMIKSVHAIL